MSVAGPTLIQKFGLKDVNVPRIRTVLQYLLVVAVLFLVTNLTNPGADYYKRGLLSAIRVDFADHGPLRIPLNKTFSFIMHSHSDPGWLVTMQEYEALAVGNMLNSTSTFLNDEISAAHTDRSQRSSPLNSFSSFSSDKSALSWQLLFLQ